MKLLDAVNSIFHRSNKSQTRPARRSSSLKHRSLRCEQLDRREVLTATLASSIYMPVTGGVIELSNVAVDSASNTYFAGKASPSADPATPATVDLDPQHSYADNHDLFTVTQFRSFVAKYDSTGALQWTNWSNDYELSAVFVGSVSGDVYVIRPGAQQNNLRKLDSSTGVEQWTSAIDGGQIAIDEQADPSKTRIYSISSQPISGYGFAEVNAYGVTSSGLSPLLWTAGTTYASGSSAGYGSAASNIIVSPDHKSIYVVGNFKGNVDFDPSPRSTYKLSTGSTQQTMTLYAGYVWKLNSSGGFVWADAFTVSKSHSTSTADFVRIDPAGNVIVGGTFGGDVDLDPGRSTFKPIWNWSNDVYVAKLTPGGSFITANSYGTANADLLLDLVLDSQGNVYADVNIQPLPNQPDLKLDSQIVKFSNSLAWQWSYAYGQLSQSGYGASRRLAFTADGRLMVFGTASGDFYAEDGASPTFTLSQETIVWLTLTV